jgi:hypothetical protein
MSSTLPRATLLIEVTSSPSRKVIASPGLNYAAARFGW